MKNLLDDLSLYSYKILLNYYNIIKFNEKELIYYIITII